MKNGPMLTDSFSAHFSILLNIDGNTRPPDMPLEKSVPVSCMKEFYPYTMKKNSWEIK